jgi:hypothetical protein
MWQRSVEAIYEIERELENRIELIEAMPEDAEIETREEGK